jgi:hypothetical protein
LSDFLLSITCCLWYILAMDKEEYNSDDAQLAQMGILSRTRMRQHDDRFSNINSYSQSTSPLLLSPRGGLVACGTYSPWTKKNTIAMTLSWPRWAISLS